MERHRLGVVHRGTKKGREEGITVNLLSTHLHVSRSCSLKGTDFAVLASDGPLKGARTQGQMRSLIYRASGGGERGLCLHEL